MEEFTNRFKLLKRQSLILKDDSAFFLGKKKLFEKFFFPKVICFCSLVPFPYEFGYLLNKIINYTIKTNKENKNQPNNKEVKDDNNNNNKEIKDNKNNNNSNNKEIKGDNNNKDDKNNNNNKKINKNKVKIPIEKIIAKIVMEVPMPMRGIFHINFKNNNTFFKSDEQFIIKQKLINTYYCPTYSLQSIFTFNTDDIIEIYKSLLLEIPVLFFSKDIEKLTNIYESFISLLYPLQFQYPHVSILPNINSAIIQNIKIFVFGINQEWIKIIEKKNDKDKNKGKDKQNEDKDDKNIKTEKKKLF